MKDLTAAQKKTLDFIIAKIKENGISPTIRELCKALGVSSTSVPRFHLKALEKKGYLKFLKKAARGIELLPKSSGIPMLGKVSAGFPKEAIENPEGYVDIKNIFSSSNDLFALSVKGESMINAGILNGDIAIVKKQNTANDNDIVVALINDEALLKIFSKKEDGIHLTAANPNYETIVTKEAIILGKLINIIRNYENKRIAGI